MRTKKGRILHSKGRKLPFNGEDKGPPVDYAAELAAALRREMERRRVAAKTVMRWTGASERTVKAWLSGISVPSGEHLVALMRHSDEVFVTVLRLSARLDGERAGHLDDVRRHLAAASTSLEKARSWLK
ncbi:MAG: XRE family transcriptional regulator [Acetobacteraceae bacterium]|nr:XRE family transcriptional regulator [Acetobacteraceae bacterium]